MKVARKRWREAKEGGEAQARAVPAEQPFSVMAIRVCSCLSQPGPRIGDYCRLGRGQQPDHGGRTINQASRREVDSSWASSPGLKRATGYRPAACVRANCGGERPVRALCVPCACVNQRATGEHGSDDGIPLCRRRWVRTEPRLDYPAQATQGAGGGGGGVRLMAVVRALLCRGDEWLAGRQAGRQRVVNGEAALGG